MSVRSAVRVVVRWVLRLFKGKKYRYAGHQLGFDPTRVHIENGVARVKIGYLQALRPADIRLAKEALRARGAVSAVIRSGPVEEEKLAALLSRMHEIRRPFFGGRVRFVEEQGGYLYFEIRFDSLD